MQVEEAIRPTTTREPETKQEVRAPGIAEGAKRVFVKFTDAFVSRFNPRPAHEVGDLSGMVLSFKAVGCLQEPLARPVIKDGRTCYEVIYGQRRFRTGEIAFADEGGMWMKVKDMTDEEALLAALNENAEHRPMTPVDEARSAAAALGMFNGDRAEAAARLGWKPAVLSSRLKLMACSTAVLDRLSTDPKFPMGIAELLAGLKSEDQDLMLAKYDEMVEPTTASFKQVLMQASKKLSAAIFNKDACAGCANNSSVQRSMFDAGLDDGHCMNAACFDSKSEEELNLRVEALRPSYQVVKIARPGEHLTTAKLLVGDQSPVGDEQYTACRSCANYGAVVSGLPDSIGRRGTNVCFDVSCFKTKVAAYATHLKEQEEDSAHRDHVGAPSEGRPTMTSANSKRKTKAPAKAGTKAPPKLTPSVQLTGPVKEFRDALYRTVLAKEVAKEPRRGLSLLIALAATHRVSTIDSTKARVLLQNANPKAEIPMTSGLVAAFEACASLEGKVLGSLASVLSHLSIDSLSADELSGLVSQLDPDWNEHFKLGKEFLAKLTKNEMQAMAQELGMDKILGDAFSGIWKLKVSEIHDKLTNIDGFNYNGAIPRVLKPGFGKD